MSRRALGFLLILLLLAPTSAQALNFKFNGTTYPLRWGAADSNDDVAPRDHLYAVRNGQEVAGQVCFKRNSSMSVSLVVEEGDPVTPEGWSITRAKLVRKSDLAVVWDWIPEDGDEMKPISQTITIPHNMPDYVAACGLDIEILLQYPPPIEEPVAASDPVEYVPTPGGALERPDGPAWPRGTIVAQSPPGGGGPGSE